MFLHQNLPRTTNFVFPNKEGGHLSNNFKRDFGKVIAGSGLSNIKKVTPHVMRHTFISHLLIYGKQDIFTVSKLAGHSSINTTQIYLHLLGGEDTKRSAVDSLPEY
ncbi:MAG TPA: hypothetical protein DCF87_02600 [Opitutae bacterium]|nr:hypothetical protein [Opitutae bacterium]